MYPGLVLPSVFTIVDRFSSPMFRMRGAMGSFISKSEIGLARLERGFRRVMSPLTNFQNTLRGLGLYAGLFTIVMLLRSAVGVMADFEQAQINIKAVTGKSIMENKALADQARKLSLRYGEAAKSVLDLDLALIKLGFKEADVLQMSAPIITGSVALKANPEDLAKTTGAILQAMKMPVSRTQEVIDKLAKAADLSALDWYDLQTMLPRAMQSASLAGLNLDQLLSLFAMARNAQVHVASGSVAIKNMLIKGAIWNKDIMTMLKMISESPDKIKKAYKMFQSRTLVTALPLAEALRLGSLEDFEKKLQESYNGYANQVASVRLDSIRGKLTLFRRSYEVLVLAIDDGRGPIGTALKQYLDAGSAVMLIAANSDAAREKLAKMDSAVINMARSWIKWIKIIAIAITVILVFKAIMIAWNAVLITIKLGLIAFNAVLYAYQIAVAGVTVAQWLWNAAMAANPIGLIIIGVSLLIALVIAMIAKWDEWGAAIAPFLGWLGLAISLVMTFRKHWDHIVDSFTKKGFLAGIKAIGVAILDAIIYPFQKLFELLSTVRGFGWAGSIASGLQSLRDYINDDKEEKALMPTVTYKGQTAEELYPGLKSLVDVTINNKTDYPVTAKQRGGATLKLVPESTMDWVNF